MNLSDFARPVLGFSAFSGSGKTTLLEKLIPVLKSEGLRILLIKHSHHDFELDKPGKDSYRLRHAGADQIMLASQYRTAWIKEEDGVSEPQLAVLLSRLDVSEFDLVLVEGFRHEAITKIEIHRPALNTPMLCAQDERIIAVACDAPPASAVTVPLLPLNDPQVIACFIQDWLYSLS